MTLLILLKVRFCEGLRGSSTKLNMSMACRASRLAMAAAKAKQPSRTAKAAAKETAAAAAAESATKVSKRGLVLKTPVPVSPAMEKFLGVSEVSRGEAMKKVWEHIKTNNLQNPANKKEIHCDEKLKGIFGPKENVTFLEIAKLMSPHFIKK